MVRVEPAFNCARKTLMIFIFNALSPRLWMNTKPCGTLSFPLLQQMKRNRVAQAKSNEVGRAQLLPMGKTVLSLPNLCVRIEKTQFVRSGGVYDLAKV